ncbi:MAG: TonB-dependent receptor [Microscillaceae bacterium]|jgi:TonB-linked SusC/RagA family outer membrane protein|nr:TonB-dependent receptor [Microscillaceae bacterium]
MWKYVLINQFKNLPLLIGLLGFSSFQLFAQPPLVANQLTASSKTRLYQEKAQSRTLKTVLSELENRMKISVSYDSETIQGKNVDANVLDALNRAKDAETSLRILLNPFQLDFEKLAENYYVIVKSRKKTKIQKLGRKTNLELIETPKIDRKLPRSLKTEILEKNNVSTETTRSISGTVKDSKGEPIPGVAVIVKNTMVGTTTDINGKYTLNVPEGSNVLIFSSVGYLTQEITLDANAVIDVVLQDNVANLQEIVVIGYGTVQKSDLTGSVASLKSDEIVKIPSFNPLQALQGKIAGVQVSSSSGAPGEAPVVRIRGVGTTNDASPLYVVDGVFVNDISFISPADIESMEVLKDASSTAIYGSRGANGVVIVTTRRGKEGKTRVAVNGRVSQQIIPQKLDLLNGREFATVVNEFAPGTFNNIDLVPNIDWQSEIFTTPAPIYDFDVSFSGGSSQNSYYVGIGYFNQKGVVPKSFYDRLNLKLNNRYSLTSKLQFGHDITVSRYTRKNAPNVVATAYRSWPTDPPRNAAGQFLAVRNAGNALADLEYTNNRTVGVRAAGSVYGTLTILRDFTFKSSLGFDGDLSKSESFAPVFFVSPIQQNPTNDLFKANNEAFTWVWENTLNYFKKMGNHQLDALLGYTMQESRAEFLNGGIQNLLREDPSQWYINAGDVTTRTVGNNALEWAMISYLFRANYSFKSKYLLTFTGRVDQSSRFGRNKRTSFFPSVAAGWNISQESFMQSVKMVDNLKLRASYGVLGNDKIDPYAQFARVGSVDAVFGNALQPGATLSNLGNPDLGWENTAMLDIGLEIGLLNNRLTAEFDYFQRVTSDILIALNVPGHAGIGFGSRVLRNAAKVKNTGLEFNINWNDQIGEVKYQIGILGNTLRNRAINLGGSENNIFDGNLGNGQQVSLTQAGQPLGAFYGYQVIGVFQTLEELNQSARLSSQGVGDLRFADLNGDGVITPAGDRTFIGSPIPDFIYGFNLGATYKSFSLSLDFQGQMGNEIYNGKQAVRPEIYNFEGRVRNRWTGPGTSNTEPRATAEGANYSPSNYFIENGSFLRLRNISLSYNVPQSLLDKLKLSTAKIYLSGTNVFTLTQFTGYSPEIGSNSPISAGIDLGIYPITAIYSIGFNVGF